MSKHGFGKAGNKTIFAWKSQTCKKDKEYKLQITTNDKVKYETMQELACFLVDNASDPFAIIKELREKLAKAEAEKKAAVECLQECVVENDLCNGCKNWNGACCTDKEARSLCEGLGIDCWGWKGATVWENMDSAKREMHG